MLETQKNHHFKASFNVFMEFKNIPINIRQEIVSLSPIDQTELLINTALSYEKVGMPTLSLYTLSRLSVKEIAFDLSSQVSHENLKDKSPLYDSMSQQAMPDSSQSAINSGQIDFDDWSWGTTTLRKFDTTRAFGSSGTKKSSCLEIPTRHFDLVRGYTNHLLHLLHIEIEESLRLSQYPGSLPKTIIFEYLDKVKIGIQKIHQFFSFYEQGFDLSLVRWCVDSDKALLGFDLLYQGILSHEINGRLFVYALNAECVFLFYALLQENKQFLYSNDFALSWIQAAFRDFGRWSVALRLTSDSAQASSQLQIIVLFLYLLYIFYLIKAREYKKLFNVLKQWKDMIEVLEKDMMSLDPVIKLLVESDKKVIAKTYF